MKALIAIMIATYGLFTLACGGGKQATTKSSAEALVDNAPAPPKSAVPHCILKMIDSTKKLEQSQQLTEVRRYVYNGAKVYLVGMPCCDQYNAVYDSACNYLFAPSGGFTGKGDRSHPDFFTEAKEDSLIWTKAKQ